MAYLPIDLMTSETRERRRLKVETDDANSAFGAQAVTEDTPLIQITGQYGILDDVITVSLGGSTYTENSNFVASTGVGVGNVAAIIARVSAGSASDMECTFTFKEGL